MSTRSRDILLLAGFAALYFGAGLGARDLWNPNEGTYGRAVVEMVESDEWLVPTLNDEVFAEKPILYYWAARTSALLFGGVSELTLRLPQLVVGVASAVFVFLLVADSLGRRRAWIAAAVFATMYQVWWSARAVQMDSFVLLGTLVTVHALTGTLERGWSPRRAWLVAGLAVGLGFSAKGPVAVILPGIVLAGYLAASKRRPGPLLELPAVALGSALFLATAAPWFLFLALRGEIGALHEVLVRQNFSRFVAAWDHDQPWWYFLEYFWIDYAPWAWLVPLAAYLRPASELERSLHRLAWVWIAGIVLFFSLADSKRAPYILPIAPAIAVLASAVIDRMVEGSLTRGRRRAALAIHALFGGLLFVAGLYLLRRPLHDEIPAAIDQAVVGAVLAGLGGVVLAALAWRRRSWLAPVALAASLVGLFLFASLYLLPAFDELKSHRGFSEELAERLGPDDTLAAHFGIYKWVRGGYSYYLGRSIRHLDDTTEIEAYWHHTPSPCLLLEEPEYSQLGSRLEGAVLVFEGRIGSETARLVCRRDPSG